MVNLPIIAAMYFTIVIKADWIDEYILYIDWKFFFIVGVNVLKVLKSLQNGNIVGTKLC